ncbi:hypothetical protein BKA61DRAFT_703924 [Leptodontidium sp. MPI-SDFR-AT-0119]|nr:hypothetical protein BKA61DRAFT_703924 [Leptodontidium sp. MPI-SDFR-AT-0119]
MAGTESKRAATALTPHEIEEILKIARALATSRRENNFKAAAEQLRPGDGEKGVQQIRKEIDLKTIENKLERGPAKMSTPTPTPDHSNLLKRKRTASKENSYMLCGQKRSSWRVEDIYSFLERHGIFVRLCKLRRSDLIVALEHLSNKLDKKTQTAQSDAADRSAQGKQDSPNAPSDLASGNLPGTTSFTAGRKEPGPIIPRPVNQTSSEKSTIKVKQAMQEESQSRSVESFEKISPVPGALEMANKNLEEDEIKVMVVEDQENLMASVLKSLNEATASRQEEIAGLKSQAATLTSRLVKQDLQNGRQESHIEELDSCQKQIVSLASRVTHVYACGSHNFTMNGYLGGEEFMVAIIFRW